NGQVTREEIDKAQADSGHRMKLLQPKHAVTEKKRSGPRYTPVSRRQDRPDAIMWMVRNHPEISDAQISKLLGTTKPTIQAVRDRTHWNSPNIKPVDPVTLGLCLQTELDEVVRKAAAKRALMEPPVEDPGPALEPTADEAPEEKPEMDFNPEKVFGNFTATKEEG
ncbi:MAG: DUF1013 domain-containing protein, partial [Pseudomonadota bacterium]